MKNSSEDGPHRAAFMMLPKRPDGSPPRHGSAESARSAGVGPKSLPHAGVSRDARGFHRQLKEHLDVGAQRKDQKANATESMLRRKQVRKLKDDYLNALKSRTDGRAVAMSPRDRAVAETKPPSAQHVGGQQANTWVNPQDKAGKRNTQPNGRSALSMVLFGNNNIYGDDGPKATRRKMSFENDDDELREELAEVEVAEPMWLPTIEPQSGTNAAANRVHQQRTNNPGELTPSNNPKVKYVADTALNRDAGLLVHEHLINLRSVNGDLEGLPADGIPPHGAFVALKAAFGCLSEVSGGELRDLAGEIETLVDRLVYRPSSSDGSSGSNSAPHQSTPRQRRSTLPIVATSPEKPPLATSPSQQQTWRKSEAPDTPFSISVANRAVVSESTSKQPFSRIVHHQSRELQELSRELEKVTLQLKRLQVHQQAVAENNRIPGASMSVSAASPGDLIEAGPGFKKSAADGVASLTDAMLQENRRLRIELRDVKREFRDSKAEIKFFSQQTERLQERLTQTFNRLYEMSTKRKNGEPLGIDKRTAQMLIHESNISISQMLSLPFAPTAPDMDEEQVGDVTPGDGSGSRAVSPTAQQGRVKFSPEAQPLAAPTDPSNSNATIAELV